MTLDQTIAIISGLAALVTALAALLTVRQIQKQIQASYRPELILSPVPVIGVPGEHAPLPTSWEADHQSLLCTGNREEARQPTDYSRPFRINIYNIGLGAATNVRVEWNLPLANIVGKLNQLTQRALIPAYYEYKNLGRTEAFSLESETWRKFFVVWGNERHQSINYVMPESAQPSVMSLIVPFTFIYAVSAYVYLGLAVRDSGQDMPEIEPLNANISYDDISGTEHHVSFNLRFAIISITGLPDSNTPMRLIGYIQPEKVREGS